MFKIPKKTSVLKTHDTNNDQTISFAPELIKFVKEKKKYKTYRLTDQKYPAMKVGDSVSIKEYGGAVLGPAKIISKTETTFLNLPLVVDGHETPRSKEHQRKIFNGYYAFLGRPIRDDDPFLIIEFKLI